MSQSVTCPNCHSTLRMRTEPAVGKPLKCPKCQAAFRYQPPEELLEVETPAETAARTSGSRLVPLLIAGALAGMVLGGLAVYLLTRPDAGEIGRPAPADPQVAAAGNPQDPNPLPGAQGNAPAGVRGAPPRAQIPGNGAAKPADVQPVDLNRPARLEGPGGAVADLAFSPDSRQLAVFTRKGAVSLWNLATRAELSLKEPEQRDYAKNQRQLIAFTADGKSLIAGNAFQVSVWNAATGQLVHQFGKLPEGITETNRLEGLVATSEDGTLIVTVESPGDGSERFHVWSTSTGQERLALDWKAIGGEVLLKLSPDNKLLVIHASGSDQTRIFDLETGKEGPPHRFGYDSLVLLSGPRRLIGWNGRKYFEWEIKPDATFELKHRLEFPLETEAPYRPIVAAPDGGTLIFPDGRLWDVASRKVKTAAVPNARFPVQLTPDGSTLLALAGNTDSAQLNVVEADAGTGEVRLIHEFGERKQTVLGPEEPFAASRDGKLLAVATQEGHVHLKPLGGNKVPTLRPLATLPLPPEPTGFEALSARTELEGTLRFTHDGRYLRFSTFLWDVAARKFLFQIAIPPVVLYRDRIQSEIGNAGVADLVPTAARAPITATLVPGNEALWVTGNGTWVIPTSSETLHRSNHFRLFELALAGDPRKMPPIDPERHAIVLKYTIPTGLPKGKIDLGFVKMQPVSDTFEPHRLEASPDGRTVLGTVRTIRHKLIDRGPEKSAGVDEEATPPFHLALLDNKLQEQAVLIEDYDGPLGVFSPDGKLLALAADKAIRLWEVATRREIVNAAEPGDSLGFTGPNLAITSQGKLVRYDIATGQRQSEIDLNRGHAGNIRQVAYLPDALRCATVGYDGYLLLRDLQQGDVLARRAAHTAACDGVACSPDGKLLATVSTEEKNVKLWEIPDPAAADLRGGNEVQIVRITAQPRAADVPPAVEPVNRDAAAAAEAEPAVAGADAPQPRPAAKGARPPKVKVLTNSLGMKLVQLSAGEFQMGAPGSDDQAEGNEVPPHPVRITKPFAIGMYEVTYGQFQAFVDATGYRTDAEQDGLGAQGYDALSQQVIEEWQPRFNWRNSGFLETDNHPVINVSWNDAKAFCGWLTAKEGKTYRLPTEAEWEYACRAGTRTRYWTGDDGASLKGAENLGDESLRQKWHKADWVVPWNDGHPLTAPVGSFQANPWGLFDMHGNVAERVEDRHDPEYYAHSPEVDPPGPSTGENRVVRAGSWYNDPFPLRSSFRLGIYVPTERNAATGFRIAREP